MQSKYIVLFLAVGLFASVAHADATTTPESASSTQEIATSTPPVPDTFTLTIRDGAITVFSGVLELPATTTPDVMVAPTTGDPIAVNARSLLSSLVSLDTAHDEFQITDLAYFPSF